MGPLEATDICGKNMTLKWNPPKDNGGQRIDYIVEQKKGTDDWGRVRTAFKYYFNHFKYSLDT